MPYTPTRGEYVFTGVFGVCLYVAIGLQAIILLRRGIKLKTSKLFFCAIIVMAILEQPRYMELAVQGDYDSRVCYCFHILAGIAFFAAFSVVGHQWSGLLALSSSFKFLYGFQALVSANVLFAVFDVLSIGLCLAAATLQDYFKSPGFEVLTLVEAVRNVAYCGLLAYYGVFLVCRFVHFSSIDTLQAPEPVSNPISSAGSSAGQLSSPLSAQQGGVGQSPSQSQCQSLAAPLPPPVLEEPTSLAFRKAAVRLSAVLVVATICYLMRAIMLIVKVAIIQNEKQGGAEGGSTFFEYSSPSFPLFGFLWFVCTDFLPRGVPSIVFMALMAKGRSKRSSVNTLTPTHLPSGKASSFSRAPSASVGSSFKPSFSGRRGFFAGYGQSDDGMSGDEGGFGAYEEEGEDFQFVQLAGDEHAREGGAAEMDRARSVSAELRGELQYLSDDSDDDGGLDDVLIQAAFASSSGSGKRVVNL